ncbi:MAG: neutral/alkaline non-lysosomal ceramidase N-terminal domain-containing protein [Planctomycetota bacterium]
MVTFRNIVLLILAALLPAWIVQADERADGNRPEWKAATASAVITPEQPLRMRGYAARKEPAKGTEQDLFAKALAIEDRDGQRVVIVTMDLIGVLGRLRDTVAQQVQEKHQLPGHALLMNASHTHCGPAYGRDDAKPYFDTLADTLIDIVGQSLDELEPATLSYGHARCGFAMNRRTPTEDGYRNHPNPEGPIDHTVPALSVLDPNGQRRAVLFGYACHNTTMGFRKWLGDYAGFAQEYFEQDHPGVTAMFLMGCGADQNPYPRSELHYAHKHGRALATAVERALEVGQKRTFHQRPLNGPLRCVLETVDLPAAKPDRSDFPYPVQIIRFGDELAIIALGNEVVVDYSLRLKRELAEPEGPAIWVAGYSNSYQNYIASERVLKEGGYESRCCPWKPGLEEKIVGKVHELYQRPTTREH